MKKIFRIILLMIIITIPIPVSSWRQEKINQETREQQKQERVNKIAQDITVKVLAGDSEGSGFIIKKQEDKYIVLTNAHVLNQASKVYHIETPDGILHNARPIKAINLKNYDLALLEFQSNHKKYTVATLGKSSELKIEEPVIATGFPYANNELKISRGKISLVLQRSFQEGYQIGYSNDVEQGMSGGPVLNNKGEVVGINGMLAYPLWGGGYVYEDGDKPSPEFQEILKRYSWAIPIETFQELIYD